MAVIVSEEEKSRARHHLGYLDVTEASTFIGGVPAAVQTQFMVEGSFNRLTDTSVARFRQLLCRLDSIEEQVFCGIDLADVDKLDQITVNRKRLSELAEYYLIAVDSLANLLGVPRSPFDFRGWLNKAGGGINVPVM